MKIFAIVFGIAVVVAGGGAAVYFLGQGGGSPGLGDAAPRDDAAYVGIEWFLSEGELMQGTEQINMPVGMNLALKVDNDIPDTLIVEGMDVEFDLPENDVADLLFYAHKTGRFNIRLKSNNNRLGILDVSKR